MRYLLALCHDYMVLVLLGYAPATTLVLRYGLAQ